MLLVSAYDVIVDPARTIIIILQSIMSIGCIILCFLTIYFFKKKNPDMKKSYLFGIPLFFLFIGIARGILIYHDFYASDDLDLILWAIANIVVTVGFISLNYTIETNVYTKSKHFFTILGIFLLISFITAIFIDKFIATLILYAINITQFLPTFGIYLIVARQATGEVKKRAITIVIGILVLFLSQSTSIFLMIGLMDRISSTMIAPPMALVGLFVLSYGFIAMSK